MLCCWDSRNVSMPCTSVFDSESNIFATLNQFGKPSKSILRPTQTVNNKAVNNSVFAQKEKQGTPTVCECVRMLFKHCSCLTPQTAKPPHTSYGKDQTQ